MKKILSILITVGLLITATPAVTAKSTTVRLTGRSVIYDVKNSKYIIFFIDKNYREYIYQAKGKKDNNTIQLFKRAFINKKVSANISNGRIIGELIP